MNISLNLSIVNKKCLTEKLINQIKAVFLGFKSETSIAGINLIVSV